jgi:RNA polymerase sigma factor FliA
MSKKRRPYEMDWSAKDLQTEALSTFQPVVFYIANRYHRKVKSFVDLDDLIQAGSMGVLEALKMFQPEHGFTFKSYVEIRVRGFVLDEIRKLSETSRKQFEKNGMVQKVYISQSDAFTDADRKRLSELLVDLSVDAIDATYLKEMYFDISCAVSELPEKQQAVVILYFYAGLTLNEIGIKMGFTESRASQLLTLAKKSLEKSDFIQKYEEEFCL